MSVIRSLIMAFTCFSRIPMPQVNWQEEGSMRYMMCFFPFIGIVIGLVVWLWTLLCEALGIGAVLFAAGVALLPVALTGGIHLDGFGDVVDAQSSHAEPERKREILKDPHVGAFAVFGIASYLILYAALATELPMSGQTVLMLGCVYWCVRCASSFATVVFPKSSEKGMLAGESKASNKTVTIVVSTVCFVVGAVALVAAGGITGAVMVAVALLCLVYVRLFAERQFGGMSGDLAGYYLQLSEILMVACLALVPKVLMLL